MHAAPRLSALVCVLSLTASQALAQRRPPPPPPGGAAPSTPQTAAPAAQPGDQVEGSGMTLSPTIDCETVRRRSKFSVYFDKVDIEKLVQVVADATCKTFILADNVRGKISIIGPEKGKSQVSADQFYAAFLASLDANNLTVYPHGRFMKIIEKNRAKQYPIPTLEASDPIPLNEQMVTRIFRIQYVEMEPLRNVLQQLVSPQGDTVPFAPDVIIINDIGTNMARLERLIRQLDSPASHDEIRVIQVEFANAQEIADKIQKLFEAKPRPGQRQGATAPAVPGGSAPRTPGADRGGRSSRGGPATLTQIIPDERTNKLIVVASATAFDRIQALVREIDVPISGEGRINVYYLENANAEELAATLQSLAQGSANRPPTPGLPRPPPGAPKTGTVTAAELFSGEVKISADKATNSLVIVASQTDYRNLVRVIERLDIQRRQVFVEAVIMEINLDRSGKFGLEFHGAQAANLGGEQVPLAFGTKLSTKEGLPPSFNLGSLASFGGFLAGLQGPALSTALGIQIPAFGIILHALQESSDVNVLSTPHLLTSDNEEAEITVGQTVPFVTNPGIGGGLSSLAATAGQTGSLSALSGLGGLGGLGSLGGLYPQVTREKVELKLSIKPQINQSDFIRMVINEQTEEIASEGQYGPTTSRRTAKTTVVAKDQETVVIGGIIQDRTVESASKVPVLGDLPLLGNLFRYQTRRKQKTNLLLFLTPYIIRDQTDFARIFARKMRERQAFVEQFYGQLPGYEAEIDFTRKAGPLMQLNRTLLKEQTKPENGGPGDGSQRVIGPLAPPPASPGEPEPPPEVSPAPPEITVDPSAPTPAPPPPERLDVQPEQPPGGELQ